MTESTKRTNERRAFLRFVEITGIEADTSTILQLDPPNPDIICRVEGSHCGFELTALTDQIIERKFGTGRFHYSNYRIDIADAVECVTRKQHKKYSMPRVDLIVHEGSTPIDDLWLWDQSELDAAMQQVTDKTIFAKVWLVDISSNLARVYVPSIHRG
jgi:hypothetical protein